MKIPKEINIAGRTIKIEWTEKELLRRGNDGEADYRGQTIFLADNSERYGQCKEDLNIVFVHEIVHFINHVVSADMDEKTVERFSEILYQVIKQLK